MLATEYMTKNPTGIKSLILASPCIKTQMWLSDANQLRSELPQNIQDSLTYHEERGTITAQGYINATEEFYKRHVCRIPFPKEVQKSFDDQGIPVYTTMWGNNEFTSTGHLKTFDRTDVLPKISVATLFTCGEFDEATPKTTRWYSEQVKNSEFKIIKGAAHMTMNERPDEYSALIREFLRKNEK
jgi:proline iminopeptidase